MKNFFTTVDPPRGASGDLGRCAEAICELISQLRLTLNSIDLDNMTPELRKNLSELPRFYSVNSAEDINIGKLRRGDIVLVADEGSLSKIREVYLYTGEEFS